MENNNYALVQRPAPYSWEAMTELLATEQESQNVRIIFPRPVIIVSAYPSVAVFGGDDTLPFPTLDDILVKIEVDTGIERRLTSRFDSTINNGVGALPNVTLGSYRDTTGGARVMWYELGAEGSRPELQITFSWKRDITGGPYFQDLFAALCFHCCFQDGR
jgi:hypothetical protein